MVQECQKDCKISSGDAFIGVAVMLVTSILSVSNPANFALNPANRVIELGANGFDADLGGFGNSLPALRNVSAAARCRR
jgi:hypothetical protein